MAKKLEGQAHDQNKNEHVENVQGAKPIDVAARLSEPSDPIEDVQGAKPVDVAAKLSEPSDPIEDLQGSKPIDVAARLTELSDSTSKPAQSIQKLLKYINLAPIERKIDVPSGTLARHIQGKTKAFKAEHYEAMARELKGLAKLINDVVN